MNDLQRQKGMVRHIRVCHFYLLKWQITNTVRTGLNCVGYLDDILFPSRFKSQSDDCGDYHDRKLGYTMSALIASDFRHKH